MKNTRENVIKLLKQDRDLLYSLQKHYAERGEKEWEDKYMRERWGIEIAINLLEDNKYFNDIYNALNKEESK